MENVNVAIFYQLKDNLPCQRMGEDGGTGSLKQTLFAEVINFLSVNFLLHSLRQVCSASLNSVLVTQLVFLEERSLVP